MMTKQLGSLLLISSIPLESLLLRVKYFINKQKVNAEKHLREIVCLITVENAKKIINVYQGDV